MLVVPDPVSPGWLYDTDETRDDNPQLPMANIQDPVNSGGFYNGDNSRRDDVFSLVQWRITVVYIVNITIPINNIVNRHPL